MFLRVSLAVPSSRVPKLMITIGGTWLMTLKKEKGAQLATPFSLNVETNAIGRGTTRPTRSL